MEDENFWNVNFEIWEISKKILKMELFQKFIDTYFNRKDLIPLIKSLSFEEQAQIVKRLGDICRRNTETEKYHRWSGTRSKMTCHGKFDDNGNRMYDIPIYFGNGFDPSFKLSTDDVINIFTLFVTNGFNPFRSPFLIESMMLEGILPHEHYDKLSGLFEKIFQLYGSDALFEKDRLERFIVWKKPGESIIVEAPYCKTNLFEMAVKSGQIALLHKFCDHLLKVENSYLKNIYEGIKTVYCENKYYEGRPPTCFCCCDDGDDPSEPEMTLEELKNGGIKTSTSSTRVQYWIIKIRNEKTKCRQHRECTECPKITIYDSRIDSLQEKLIRLGFADTFALMGDEFVW